LDEVPFRDTRLIVARLLHQVLRSGHSAFADLPFTEAAEVILIVTAIYIAENDGKPFSTLGLSKHLGMPRATLLRRLTHLRNGIIIRDDGQMRVNPQMFAPISVENIRQLRQFIIDTGNELSRVDGSL